MNKVFGIIAAVLMVSTTAWAKSETIRVKAPQEVVAEQVFQVAYLIQGNGQEIQLDSNKKIELVSGPYRTSDSRDVWVKGKLQTKTWTKYVVRFIAHESGELQLPKAKIRIDGSSKSAPKTKVNVVEQQPFGWNSGFWGDSFFSDPFFQQPHKCHHHAHNAEKGQHTEWKQAEIDTTGCTLVISAPDSAKQGDNFCVTYSIGAQCDSISLTDSTHFEILGAPAFGTSWQTSWENGKHSSLFNQRYTYILRARQTGTFALPVATVWIGDTTKQSDSKSITIQDK